MTYASTEDLQLRLAGAIGWICMAVLGGFAAKRWRGIIFRAWFASIRLRFAAKRDRKMIFCLRFVIKRE